MHHLCKCQHRILDLLQLQHVAGIEYGAADQHRDHTMYLLDTVLPFCCALQAQILKTVVKLFVCYN